MLLALLAAATPLAAVKPAHLSLRHVGYGAAAMALGAALVLTANVVVAKRLAWTPGGFALSFGRMLQDGIVTKYLDEHCPRARLVLCSYKDESPHDADEWFWGNPLFNKLGRFAGLDQEMQQIALASLSEYPLLQLKTTPMALSSAILRTLFPTCVRHASSTARSALLLSTGCTIPWHWAACSCFLRPAAAKPDRYR